VTLPVPNLDDRRFQDLVDDAKRLVQRRCPEWTDHNVSDPGVTLIEAFATMVDQLLYRLNRVPERHYLRFLDLIGVRLFPPTAARADLTFWLSAAQPEPVVVPRTSQVATVRTELDEPVVFSTEDQLDIVPCALEAVVTEPAEGPPLDRTDELREGLGFGGFSPEPRPGDALYVGLTNPVPSCAVLVRVECRVEGVGVDPLDPPLRWEAWDGEDWVRCEIDRDGTGGFNRAGDVVLHLPRKHAASLVAHRRAGWIRCRVVEPEPGQPFYSASPIVTALEVSTIGGTTSAVHAEPVLREEIGRSDGSPGQRFAVLRAPVVAGTEREVLEVGGDEGWQPWTLVDDFTGSGPDDRHFVLERATGEVVLGPALRWPDGGLRQHGAVPPKGSVLVLRSYRVGGGAAGNVNARSLRVLKSSIPFVSGAENRRPAIGGVDGETVPEAMVRGPLELRTRDRAVTAADYELLARQAAPEFARVHCVPPIEGDASQVVRLLVVPDVPRADGETLEFVRLRPEPDIVERVGRHLEPRRALGARVVVEPPFYRGITVVARISARYDAAPARVRLRALNELHRYLHPLVGGPDGTGWPLGRPVTAGDVQACLQRVDGVDLVENVMLFPADPVAGTRAEAPVQRLDLGPTELAFSFEHQVMVR
jgi:predicted phage baseplate assembly protein